MYSFGNWLEVEQWLLNSCLISTSVWLHSACTFSWFLTNRLNVIGKLIQFSQLTLTYCCFISALTHQSHFEDAKWSQTWSNKFISQGHNNSGPHLVSSHSFPCCNRSVTLHLCWAGGFKKNCSIWNPGNKNRLKFCGLLDYYLPVDTNLRNHLGKRVDVKSLVITLLHLFSSDLGAVLKNKNKETLTCCRKTTYTYNNITNDCKEMSSF